MGDAFPVEGGFVAGAEDARRARRVGRQVVEVRLMCDRARADALNVSELVKILRFEGVSWSVIGEAVGVSKQAAQQRFGGADS